MVLHDPVGFTACLTHALLMCLFGSLFNFISNIEFLFSHVAHLFEVLWSFEPRSAMTPSLGLRATQLNLTHSLAVKRFPVRKKVRSSSLCKLWALQIHKNIVLRDLGFVVLLLAVKLNWHPEHFVLIWKGWLTGNSTGRHRKIRSLRHVLK